MSDYTSWIWSLCQHYSFSSSTSSCCRVSSEPFSELQVTTTCIPLGIQTTYDITSHFQVNHSCLNQLQTGFSEGTPHLSPPVLKPNLWKNDREKKIWQLFISILIINIYKWDHRNFFPLFFKSLLFSVWKEQCNLRFDDFFMLNDLFSFFWWPIFDNRVSWIILVSYIYIIMNMHVMCMFLTFVLIQYIVYILFGWDMFVICGINSRWYIFF